MTVANFVNAGGRAYMMVDGAVIGADGAMIGVQQKGVEVPHMGCFVTTAGPVKVIDPLLDVLLPQFTDIDDLAEHGEFHFRAFRKALASEYPDILGLSKSWLFLAMGWSAEKDAPRSVHFNAYPEDYWMVDVPILTLPYIEKDAERTILQRVAAKGGLANFSPDDDGMALMHAQRRVLQNGTGPNVGKAFIGGHADVIEMTRDGFTRRRMHEWAEDVIGEDIRPDAAPEVAPANMNRQQRRAWERQHGRRVAA